MDETEKERLREDGRRAGHQEFAWKRERALLWGFFGAAIGGGLFLAFFDLPEIAVLIRGRQQGWWAGIARARRGGEAREAVAGFSCARKPVLRLHPCAPGLRI